MWVFDEESNQMVNREITYVPGLYKIFDEILGKVISHGLN
jgi:DNA topoisomerase-2